MEMCGAATAAEINAFKIVAMCGGNLCQGVSLGAITTAFERVAITIQ